MPDTPEERAEAAQIGTYRRELLANPHDRDVPASPLPVIAQRALIGVFLLLLAVGVFFIAADRWRRGTTAMGASLVFLAAIQIGRASCRERV